MSNAKIQPVLDHIDADFDNSLERLFALLRIKSISADPAFAGDCKAAADHLAKDIATLGRSIRSICGTGRRLNLSSPIMPTAEKLSWRAAPRTTRDS